jgi:TolA-binding protein
MEDKRITAEELQAGLQTDVKALAETMAAAINNARAGRIIADSEEPVRDAHAVFRQRAYQLALDLLQKKALQEDFSPSQDPTPPDLEK